MLHAIASGLSATASMLSSYKGNTHLATISSINAQHSAIRAGFASAMKKEAEDFEIAVMIKNVSDSEIQVNNESRGLVWHLLPGQSLELGSINSFYDLIRVEQSTNNGPKITYFEFGIKNYLIRVSPIAQNEYWRSFRSLPFENSVDHYLNPEEKHSSSILYEYNVKTGAHHRVEE